MVIDITGGGTLPSAISGAFTALQEQRQQKLKSAMQGLDMMRTLYGGNLPPGVFENYANQIEQASKALGTPITFPRTQPTPATFSTAGTQPQNPMFRAGVGAGGAAAGPAAAAPKPQTPFPTAQGRPAPTMPQAAQPGGQIMVPQTPLGSQTFQQRYANRPDILKALQDSGYPIDRPIDEVSKVYGTDWQPLVESGGGGPLFGGPGTATQPAPSPSAPAPGPTPAPAPTAAPAPTEPRLERPSVVAPQPAVSAGPGTTGPQPPPQQQAQPQIPVPPQLADLNPTQDELRALNSYDRRLFWNPRLGGIDWMKVRSAVLDSRKAGLETATSEAALAKGGREAIDAARTTAINQVTARLRLGDEAGMRTILQHLPAGVDAQDVLEAAQEKAGTAAATAAKQQQDVTGYQRTSAIQQVTGRLMVGDEKGAQDILKQLPAGVDAADVYAQAQAGVGELRQKQSQDVVLLDGTHVWMTGNQYATYQRMSANEKLTYETRIQNAQRSAIMARWNSPDIQALPDGNPDKERIRALVAQAYAGLGLVDPTLSAGATRGVPGVKGTAAQQQAYQGAQGDLQAAYMAGGPTMGNPQWAPALQKFMTAGAAMGMTPQQLVDAVKQIAPEWKPHVPPPPETPQDTRSTLQKVTDWIHQQFRGTPAGAQSKPTTPAKPAAPAKPQPTPNLGGPTGRANGVLQVWRQTKTPVPLNQWQQLSPQEQQWLDRQGVGHGVPSGYMGGPQSRVNAPGVQLAATTTATSPQQGPQSYPTGVAGWQVLPLDFSDPALTPGSKLPVRPDPLPRNARPMPPNTVPLAPNRYSGRVVRGPNGIRYYSDGQRWWQEPPPGEVPDVEPERSI